MARNFAFHLLKPPAALKRISALKLIFLILVTVEIVSYVMQRCEAAAVKHRQTLPNRAEMASAIAALPSSPVRRSLLKALSASYGVSFTWPFTWSSTGSSSSSEAEPNLSWYTTSSTTSSSSSSSSSSTGSGASAGDQQQQQQTASSTSSSSPTPSPSLPPSPSPYPNTGSTPAYSSSSSNNLCWRSDSTGGGTEYLTVSSKCPNDDFNIAIFEYNTSWTFDDSPIVYGVYFSAGWAGTTGLVENQQIRPRQQDGDSGQYVAILRVKDGKWVAPKGVRSSSSSSRVEDGSSGGSSSTESWFDISSSKRRVCVLVGESSDRPFPRFRIVVKTDGDRVLADSVAAVGEPIFKGLPGVYCEDLKHEPVLGYHYYDKDYTQGQFADAYDPSGCKIVIDACSL